MEDIVMTGKYAVRGLGFVSAIVGLVQRAEHDYLAAVRQDCIQTLHIRGCPACSARHRAYLFGDAPGRRFGTNIARRGGISNGVDGAIGGSFAASFFRT
jgi:hypothetical protein